MPVKWTGEVPLGLADIESNASERYGTGGDLVDGDRVRCCVRGCSQWLERRRRGQEDPGIWCRDHGISVSKSPTYVYRDYRRNFLVDVPLLQSVKDQKVESWRLGNERSEDALSWNVFVSLQQMGELGSMLKQLVGIDEQPELYLWGVRIDDNTARPWERLKQVRKVLEPDARFPTEPDIILRVPGRVLLLIEAKFGSANGTLVGKEERFGSVVEFLETYEAVEGSPDPLNRSWIQQQPADQVLEQLCRNVIFAQRLAERGEGSYVVNLVREQDATDVQAQFDQHLVSNGPVLFRRATWESCYRLPTMASPAAAPLKRYLENKTNRFVRAFAL